MHVCRQKLITERFQNKKLGTNLIKTNFKGMAVGNILHSFILIKIWKLLNTNSKGIRIEKLI